MPCGFPARIPFPKIRKIMKNDTDFLSTVRRRLDKAIDEERRLREEIKELVEMESKLKEPGGVKKTAEEILGSEVPNTKLLLRAALSQLKQLLTETVALRELRGLHDERMKEITTLQNRLKPYLNEEELIHFIIE